MAHKHLKNSTLTPNMQEAAQLIAWAIQRMLKFVPFVILLLFVYCCNAKRDMHRRRESLCGIQMGMLLVVEEDVRPVGRITPSGET